MIFEDDRNVDQVKSHYLLVIGTDSAMSGWGGAEGGTSYAAWATDVNHRARVERWVRSRREMKRVRVIEARNWHPRGSKSHAHIYVIGEDHPALSRRDAD